MYSFCCLYSTLSLPSRRELLHIPAGNTPLQIPFSPFLCHFCITSDSLFPGQDISLQIKLSVPVLFLVITKRAHKPEAALWSVLLWYITRGWNEQDHCTFFFLLCEASATPLKSQCVSINIFTEKYNSLILFLKSFEAGFRRHGNKADFGLGL